jgi:hypothetical protein
MSTAPLRFHDVVCGAAVKRGVLKSGIGDKKHIECSACGLIKAIAAASKQECCNKCLRALKASE